MKDPSLNPQPVYFAAAVALIVLSAAGIAALTGHLPGAVSAPASSQAAVSAASSGERTPVARRAAAPSKSAATPCADCGVIEDIRAVQTSGQASGLGAAAGGVTGALLGSQIGRGDGRTLAAIAGAAGGAFAGNAIEKNMKQHIVYRITLRMDDGSRRVLTRLHEPPFAVGERVHLRDGTSIEPA
jgi:outer membrane lipoprotein SlyB